MDEKQKNKKKIAVILTISVLLSIGSAVMGILTWKGFFNKQPEEKGEGVVGVIVDDWETGIEDNTNSEERRGTQIPGYSSAEMNEGDTTLRIKIGNPKENGVGLYATFKLFDGTVLYESPLLEPGQGLDEIPLSQTVKKGTYDAMVVYQCVALNAEHTPLNAAESGLKLIVK